MSPRTASYESAIRDTNCITGKAMSVGVGGERQSCSRLHKASGGMNMPNQKNELTPERGRLSAT